MASDDREKLLARRRADGLAEGAGFGAVPCVLPALLDQILGISGKTADEFWCDVAAAHLKLKLPHLLACTPKTSGGGEIEAKTRKND